MAFAYDQMLQIKSPSWTSFDTVKIKGTQRIASVKYLFERLKSPQKFGFNCDEKLVFFGEMTL